MEGGSGWWCATPLSPVIPTSPSLRARRDVTWTLGTRLVLWPDPWVERDDRERFAVELYAALRCRKAVASAALSGLEKR